MSNKILSIVALAILTIGLLAGYWFASTQQQPSMPSAEEVKSDILFYRNPMNAEITSPIPAKDDMGMDYIPVYADQDKTEPAKILFYRNPMNPDMTSAVPAQDEMGMDYLPVYAEEDQRDDSPTGTVKIDGVTTQNIGVRTSKAVELAMSHTVRAVGRVDYDEEKMVRLHPKTEGWVKDMYVDKSGQWVKEDTPLLSIYSPQLVASQEEYLLALKNLKALEESPIDTIRHGAEALLNSSRERLKLLDFPAHQMAELNQSHQIKKNIHIHSPKEGVVVKIGAREGQFVGPKTQIYMIADLRKVWVYANIYEYELPWVKEGDSVEMQLVGIPGRVFKGHLAYIYPYAELKTRTIKVRLVFDNSELLLKPNMLADLKIYANQQNNQVVIPSEAVIRSGSRKQVFVVRGEGKFEPRLVTLGLESEGNVAILEGLKLGEEVVTSGQFLIDSESKLREATAKMLELMSDDNTPTSDQVKLSKEPAHD